FKGFQGVEQSLAAKPMQPGERRSLKRLEKVMNVVADVDLVARDYEDTPLLEGSRKLLRIEVTTRLPDQPKMESVMWTDEGGIPAKGHADMMAMDSYRTTQEIALAAPKTRLDLGIGATVRVKSPIAKAHETRRATYRITLEGGNPREVFAQTPYQ